MPPLIFTVTQNKYCAKPTKYHSLVHSLCLFQLLTYIRDLRVQEDSISFASHSCSLQPKYNKTEFAKGIAGMIFGGFYELTSLTLISPWSSTCCNYRSKFVHPAKQKKDTTEKLKKK